MEYRSEEVWRWEVGVQTIPSQVGRSSTGSRLRWPSLGLETSYLGSSDFVQEDPRHVQFSKSTSLADLEKWRALWDSTPRGGKLSGHRHRQGSSTSFML